MGVRESKRMFGLLSKVSHGRGNVRMHISGVSGGFLVVGYDIGKFIPALGLNGGFEAFRGSVQICYFRVWIAHGIQYP